MIDRRPAVIVRAAGAADVMHAVAHVRAHGGPLAVKGAGHNIAGNAVCDNGLTIDLSPMKAVRIDPEARTARVEPGVTLGEFDREAQAFGLATPTGINSTTGIAGLTLGGGFGWLSRKYGLTADNLLAADVVTADGRLLRASKSENPFEFRLHPVGPQVFAGLLVHPVANARKVLGGYRRVVADAPDEFACWAVLRKAPPLPFLPAAVHGKSVLILAAFYAGDPAHGADAIAPLRALGTPVGEHVGPVPYTAWQTAFDPLLTPGARNYWKSHDFRELPDGLLDLMVRNVDLLPSPDCEIFLGQLGGAINRVPPDATAYPHRDVEFVMNVHTRWNDAGQDETCIAWTRRFFEQAAPFATGGVYVNFMPGDEAQRVRSGAYGGNFDRLARIKRTYDPRNLFRMNHNIPPAP